MADVNREAAFARLRDDTGYRDRVMARTLIRLAEQAGVLDEVLAEDAVQNAAPRFGGQPAHRTQGLSYEEIKDSGLSPDDAEAAARYHGVAPSDGGGRQSDDGPADPHADPIGEAVGTETGAALREMGLGDPAAIRAASDETLLAVPGIGPGRLARLRAATIEPEEE